jgi:hypothetical protein
MEYISWKLLKKAFAFIKNGFYLTEMQKKARTISISGFVPVMFCRLKFWLCFHLRDFLFFFRKKTVLIDQNNGNANENGGICDIEYRP